MAKNECTPERIFTPVEHTVFLGCSVSSFTASAGWNQQTSEVVVQLIEDNCAADKSFWDCTLTKFTQISGQSFKDPGFLGLARWLSVETGLEYSGVQRNVNDTTVTNPNATYNVDLIGMPVYFRVEDFEFSGIIQDWKQNNSVGGRPIYTVTIVDPRQILEGAQLIIGEYAGGVGSVENVFNPFGAMEKFGTYAQQIKLAALPATLNNYSLTVDDGTSPTDGDDGAIFGSFPQGFGGALVTNNGIQWSVLLTGMNLLMSSLPKASTLGLTNFSPYGRLRFKGGDNCAWGLIKGEGSTYSEYYLDISDLPTMPADWRLNGSTVSVMDVISQVCSAAGCDYYVELLFIKDGSLSNTGIAKFIKIRTANRTTQPTLGQISTFIGDSTGLVTSTYGQELRNETTSSFIIGGPRNTLYQVEQTFDSDSNFVDDAILPYFGLDDNGNVIIPTQDVDGDWEFEAPNIGIDSQLRELSAFGSTITLTEMELRASLVGKDEWIMVCESLETDCGNKIAESAEFQAKHRARIGEIFAKFANQDLKGRDLINAVANSFFIPINTANNDLSEDIQDLYNFTRTYAEQYYGKKFQVRVPYGYAPIPVAGPAYHRLDIDNYQILTAESPSDAGWTETTTVLGVSNFGVANDSVVLEFFRNKDKKIGAFVRFDDASVADKTLLDQRSYIVVNGQLFTSCKVEDSWVYADKNTLFSPRAVVEIDQQVRQAQSGVAQLLSLINSVVVKQGDDGGAFQTKFNQAVEDVGGKNLYAATTFPFYQPDAIAIGIESNIMTYGPWWRRGPAGQVKVEQVEGLVPWEYGNYANLNVAGFAFAQEAVTNMQVGEVGSLTVPGYPQYSLGAEIGSAVIGGGQSVVESRGATSNFYSNNFFDGSPLATSLYSINMGGQWTGSTGPNITDINVSVSESQVQTSYTMRTFTPKFGRFAKHNANRLQFIGNMRMAAQRSIRGWFLERFRHQYNQRRRQREGARGVIGGMGNNDGVKEKASTPHEMLVGESTTFNTGAFSGQGSRRTPIETLQMAEFGNELNGYDHKAFMSLDGLIRPISMDGDGSLPQYASPTGSLCASSSSAGSQPPVNEQGGSTEYDETITINSLNPFENPTQDVDGNNLSRSWLKDNNRIDTDDGHDIDILGRRASPPAGSGGMTMPYTVYDQSPYSDYTDDYRGFALRGPMLMQGWGYDLDGRPIPNKADTENSAAVGIFKDTNLQCKFLDRFLRKPHTWPVGPIDLRWDRKRAVWTIPQHRLLVAQLQGDLCPGSTGLAQMIVGDELYDCDGNSMDPTNPSTAPQFIVTDKIGICAKAGTNIIAYYDPQQCEYYILESVNQIANNTDICYPTGSMTLLTDTSNKNYSNIIYGQGLNVYEVSGECNCDLYLNASISGSGDDTCVSGTEGVSFSSLIAGGGLNFEQATDCQARLGVYLGISSTTGCVSTDDIQGIGWNNLIAGGGINAATDNSCNLTLSSSLGITSSSSCIEVEDVSAGNWNSLEVAGGLIADVDENCNLRLASYLSASSSSSCIQSSSTAAGWNQLEAAAGLNADVSNCIYKIGVYLDTFVGDTCVTGNDLSEGWNTLGIGQGLRGDISDCNLEVAVYLGISSTTGCVSTDDIQGAGWNNLIAGGGINAATDNNCNLTLSSASTAENGTACITGGDTSNSWNNLKMEGGLAGVVDDACNLQLGVNLGAAGSNDCIKQTSINGGWNSLTIAGGLNATGDGNCNLTIGAYLSVSCNDLCVTGCLVPSAGWNHLIAGGGLNAVADDNCNLTIGTYLGISSTTGCVSTDDIQGAGWNNLIAGGGINAATDNSCNLTLSSSLGITSSSSCIETEDVSAGNWNSLEVAGGLIADVDENCSLRLAAYLSASTSSSCIQSSSTAAGWNQLEAAFGLEASVSNCILRLGVYLDAAAGSACISSNSLSGGWNTLLIGDGLRGVIADCDFEIATYLGISSTSGCVTSDDIQGAGWNNLIAGGGINAVTDASCNLTLGVALGVANSSSCITSTSTTDSWNNLIAGEGLNANTDGSCNLNIGAYLGASNNSTCTTDTTTTNGWNTLIAGEGLNANTDGSCNLNIGAYLGASSTSTACVIDGSTAGGWNNLILADGLNANVIGCDLEVGVAIGAANSSSCITSTTTTNPWNNLTAGAGLNMFTDANCDAFIGAYLLANSSASCITSNNLSGGWNSILVGKGMVGSIAACNLTLSSYLTASANSACITNNSLGFGWNNLTLGGGLHGITDGSCDLNIAVYLGASSASFCNTSHSNLTAGWNSIVLGNGLIGSIAGCDLSLNVAIPVDGNPTAEFVMGAGLTSETAGCVTTINTTPVEVESGCSPCPTGGQAGSVEVVTDVECSGANIVITTANINFNNIGLFTGTS